MPWRDDAIYTNPVANTVLVDTGPLPGRRTLVLVFVWADTGIEAILQLRDATNGATVASQIIPAVLGREGGVEFTINVAQNQRFRVLTRADVTGQVQASIFTDRVD